MPQDNLIKMKCSACDRINYWTRKNRKKHEEEIALKKFCRWCRKHTEHNEKKK